MKVTTLIEDKEGFDKDLSFEHGLSMFIEDDGCNVLFDSGQSGNIIENAEALNIDLNKIDFIILSHGHYDHCGGIKKLLGSYDIKPKLIVGNEFFERCNKYRLYSEEERKKLADGSRYKYIGIDFDRKFIEDKGIDIVEASERGIMKISDNIFVFSNFKKFYNFEKISNSMMYLKDNKYIIDDFHEEICVGIRTKKGLIVLMGCAHVGFLNMMKTIEERTCDKIIGIIGGTHLVKADEGRIRKSVDLLKTMDLEIIGLSHCTGENAAKVLKENYDDLFLNKTGTVLQL